MENVMLYAVLLSNFIHGVIGGEYCEVSSQSLTVSQYCEVGGCCIPNNVQKLAKDSELCCINFLIVILICIFVGLPILILTGICLAIVVKRCVKNRKQTSLTSLNGTANSLPQYQPKPPDYTASPVTRTGPVYSPHRVWQSRPSLVLPGAISQTVTSQHAQLVPSGSRDNTDQSDFPTSPPPPYSSRASGRVSALEAPVSSVSSVTLDTTDLCRNGSSSPIAMVDMIETECEAPGDNDLAFI
ncbi:uncharacterized protein LOC117338384 [Pecten maximus]|uniref:uncharacterized protein LOC117338384 n=1 Tax=Pecten maximus TaxID=6579 RepID=UPI0014591536|nr:uncharacterized protein LOC117338384 [Pecten maximus]